MPTEGAIFHRVNVANGWEISDGYLIIVGVVKSIKIINVYNMYFDNYIFCLSSKI